MKLKRIIWICLVLIWMIIIFISSAQPATVSGSNSKGIVSTVIKTAENIGIIPLETVGNQELLSRLDHYFRKATHFTVYFILALLVIKTLFCFDVKGRKLILMALIICIVYASSDEYHQLFVEGRGAQIKDVIIDSLGSMLGIFVYIIFKNKRLKP